MRQLADALPYVAFWAFMSIWAWSSYHASTDCPKVVIQQPQTQQGEN